MQEMQTNSFVNVLLKKFVLVQKKKNVGREVLKCLYIIPECSMSSIFVDFLEKLPQIGEYGQIWQPAIPCLK